VSTEQTAEASPGDAPGAVRAPGSPARRRWARPRPPWADGLWLATGLILLVAGLFTVSLMPPGQGNDEPNHFLRVNGLLNGVLVPDPHGEPSAPTKFDACTLSYLHEVEQRAIAPGPMRLGNFDDYPSGCQGQTGARDYDNTAVYSPVPYAGHLVGAGLMRLVGAGPVAALYAARILGFLLYVALVLAALRVAPTGRLFIAVVALLPMSVIQASVVSTDGAAYGLALLAAALVLRLREREEPDRRAALGLGVVLAALALTKVPHIAFVALVLLVPWRHFAPERRRADLLRAATAGVPVLLLLGWNALAGRITVSNLPTVDPDRQLSWIFEHPSGFLEVLRVSMFTDVTRDVFFQLPGAFSFFRTTPVVPQLPGFWVVCAYLALGFALAAGRRPVLVSGRGPRLQAAWALLAGLGGVALVYLALYLVWTDVGAPSVSGIQPRYFVPFLAFILVAVATAFKRGGADPPWPPFAAVSAAMLAVIVYQITLVYY
jgi:hypothetical protein